MTTVRLFRVALSTLLAWLPSVTAFAQSTDGGSDADNPALMIILVTFCVLVVGSLAYTARRMSRLP